VHAATNSPAAAQALDIIARLFAIEADIGGRSPAERVAARPTLPNSMPDLDQLLRALFLVALLLYLIPAVFGLGRSAEWRRWIQRGAILTFGTAIAIAAVASVIWFIR
jgi:hypothetical protein